jgi:hypothetical protein
MNYEAVTLGYAVDPEHPNPVPIDTFCGWVATRLQEMTLWRLRTSAERAIIGRLFADGIFDDDSSGWDDERMWFGFSGAFASLAEHWFASIASLERWVLGGYFAKHGYTLTSVPSFPPLDGAEQIFIPISKGERLVALRTDHPLHDPSPGWANGDPTLKELSERDLTHVKQVVNAKRCACSLCLQRAALEPFGQDGDELRAQASGLVEAWVEASRRIDVSHVSTLLPDGHSSAQRHGSWQDITLNEYQHKELTFSPSGARLFGFGEEAEVMVIWNVASGEVLGAFTLEDELQVICWLDEDTLFIIGEACAWLWHVSEGEPEIFSEDLPSGLSSSRHIGHGLVISADPFGYTALELIDVEQRELLLSTTPDNNIHLFGMPRWLINVRTPFDQVAPAFSRYSEDVHFIYLPTLDLHPAVLPLPDATSVVARDGVLAWVRGTIEFVRPFQPVRRFGIQNPQDEPARCVIGPQGTRMAAFHALSHDTRKGLGAFMVWDIASQTPMSVAMCIDTWSDGGRDLSEVVALSPCAGRVAWSDDDGVHVRSLL